jgi:hypothetical protein
VKIEIDIRPSESGFFEDEEVSIYERADSFWITTGGVWDADRRGLPEAWDQSADVLSMAEEVCGDGR